MGTILSLFYVKHKSVYFVKIFQYVKEQIYTYIQNIKVQSNQKKKPRSFYIVYF